VEIVVSFFVSFVSTVSIGGLYLSVSSWVQWKWWLGGI